MIHIIVNADDFGLDENRTKAILQAYTEGWISTTTIMANMPWFHEAIEMAKGSRLYNNIGLHLNLTEGTPLTEEIKKSPLFCNVDGTFNERFHHSMFHRLFLPSFERKAVAKEAQAQFEAYRKSGLSLWHLDSHHHVHTDWSIASIVLPLAQKAGFKTVRLSRNFGSGLTLFKRIYKHFLNGKLKKTLALNADFFCNFEDILELSQQLPSDCIIEVMTHPLYAKNDKLDMSGKLTEFYWNKDNQQKFWKSKKDNVRLVDYQGFRV